MLPVKNPLGLALAGLAAFAWYKYSKMTEEQKRDLTKNIKEKGKKIFDSIVPSSKGETVNSHQPFTQSTNYSG